jgi:hypothetical protein
LWLLAAEAAVQAVRVKPTIKRQAAKVAVLPAKQALVLHLPEQAVVAVPKLLAEMEALHGAADKLVSLEQ